MITLYAVMYDHPNDPSLTYKCLTVSHRKKDCEAYLIRRLMLDNYGHFSAWCKLHGQKADESGWGKYVGAGVLGDDELTKYCVSRLRYRKGDIASLFRMYNGCIPLGVGFEKEEEYELLMKALPEATRKEIEERLGELDAEQEG